ncbi:MAG: DNA polymerase III subunit gamma/tau [bacterium]
MSFLVTARKWRPNTFSELVGQEGVCRTLQNALRAGRVAHAYIFAGPRGVGKTTTARLLAKAINCVQGPIPEPCNQCIPCQEIPQGRSLDVLEIDGASNRGVGEIRNLRENIRFNPAGCHKKIYIIDEVHMLTIEAFNALLKTLEEPPEHAIFIFATTEIHRVPPTILSRCQRFDFRRLSCTEIADHLNFICQQEGISAELEALMLIARRADGAMRDGQSILDQMVTFAPEGITAEAVRLALGIIPEDLFFQVSDIVIQNGTADVFALVEEVESKGNSPSEFLRGLCEHFLNLLKARAQQSGKAIEAPQDVQKRYLETAQQFETNDLLRILAILQDAFTDIRRHPQPRLKLELTLLRLATLERTVKIEELLSELRGTTPLLTKPRSAAEPKPAVSSQPPRQATPALEERKPTPSSSRAEFPQEITYVRAHWHEIVDRICIGRQPLACQVKLGRPEKFEDEVLVVNFGNDLVDLQLERLKQLAASGSFDQGIEDLFGKPLRFRFERGAGREASTDAEPVDDLASVEDPVERELIRLLGAKRIG